MINNKMKYTRNMKNTKNTKKTISKTKSCRNMCAGFAKYKKSEIKEGLSSQDKMLRTLYGTRTGRTLLNLLVRPGVSKFAGLIMDSSISKVAIKPFIRKNDIDMSNCLKHEFRSYNDFFKRRLESAARIPDTKENGFVSPCDSRLTVYDIDDTSHAIFNIKDSQYSLEQLFRDKKLAERYRGGKLWLFRLCVDDYHRYIYNVSGRQSDVRRIEGVYHTVNPIASEYYRIYKEKTREYCLIKSENAGTIAYMEVGALLVGKIENRNIRKCTVKKGQEKGNFAFGGSTIILVTQKDKVTPLMEIAGNSSEHVETRVRQGELVGFIN